MELHRNGSYAATIREQNDGEGFDVQFLYNVTDDFNGDVWDRKCYKRESTAFKKIQQFFKDRGCQVT
jgi:hypothetical protein